MTEAQIQTQIVDYLRAVLPKEYRVFAVPNASRRTRTGRAANAVAGLTPGVPDLIVMGGSRAFLLEVKTKAGKLSDAQSEFANWAVMYGGMCWACVRSVDDVRAALREWQIPSREAA